MQYSHYTTEHVANRAQLQPQTLRAALCRHGHWCGIRPIKLPNRRLMWPTAEVEALLSGKSVQEDAI